MWADAKEELERAEEDLKVIRSELILEANKNPDKCLGDGVKLTDPKVEAYYRSHPDHKEAKEKYFAAQKKLAIIEIAKNEIAFTRKAALENLVTLHGQQYFAGPKMPRDIKYEVGQRREKRELTKQKNNAKVSLRKRRRTEDE